MSSNFGKTDTFNFQSGVYIDDFNNPYLAAGAAVGVEFIGNLPILGPAITISFKSNPSVFYGPTTESELPLFFNSSLLGGALVVGNIIARSAENRIEVDELTLTGQNNARMDIVGPSGTTNRMKGIGPYVNNKIASWNLAPTDSFSFNINQGAPGSITATLPANAPVGYCQAFIAVSYPIVLGLASASDQIFAPGVGGLKGAGVSATIPASGTAFMVCNSGLWYPFMYTGTIV